MSEDFPYLPPLVPEDTAVSEPVASGSGEQLPIIAAKTGVTIGTDFDRRVPVTVADRERQGGVYILGQPRTGKSTLLVSMALQDIKNGHGSYPLSPGITLEGHFPAFIRLYSSISEFGYRSHVCLFALHRLIQRYYAKIAEE